MTLASEIWKNQDEEDQLCICDHVRKLHFPGMCLWGDRTSMGCSCDGFQRRHVGRQQNCWCAGTDAPENRKAHETDLTGPQMVPVYVQDALDSIRADMVELKENLNGYWNGQPDIQSRVDNWHFNAWRHMEEILQAGK